MRITAWPNRFLPSLFLVAQFCSVVESRTKEPLASNATFHFITRPDIKAPRWTVTKYDENRISPGYWFVAPFEQLDQGIEDSGYGAIGAHIYDNDGELIWSGASMFGERNIMDFRISNVGGENMMTLMYQRAGSGVIMDNHYEIKHEVNIGTPAISSNPHEFLFLEDGTRALITTQHRKHANTTQLASINQTECTVLFQGFEEFDVASWTPLFKWESFDWVGLNESTYTDDRHACSHPWGWDYMHVNSVDKLPDGNYVLSARQTDAIYKISAKDGSVMWRLGGLRSDFKLEGSRWSRQHNIRFRGRNETHLFLTFLDNAKGDDSQSPTHSSSRGILIAVDEKNKKATIERVIEHPDGPGYWAWRRGNYQKLPNGNVMMCWSEQARQSEHTADGETVWKARLVSDRLGTYRAYKYPFEGRPNTLPDVHSEAFVNSHDNTTTIVHASWNGATEVDAWTLYKTTAANDTMVPLVSRQRTGFETALAYDGYAAYVIVEAVDREGRVLASSAITKTLLPDELSPAIADEVLWLQKMEAEQNAYITPAEMQSVAGHPFSLFLFGFACSVTFTVVYMWLRRRAGPNLVRWRGNPRLVRWYEPFREKIQGSYDGNANVDRDEA